MQNSYTLEDAKYKLTNLINSLLSNGMAMSYSRNQKEQLLYAKVLNQATSLRSEITEFLEKEDEE